MTREEINKKIEGWCSDGMVKWDIFTLLEKDKRMLESMETCLDGYDLIGKIPNEFKIPQPEVW